MKMRQDYTWAMLKQGGSNDAMPKKTRMRARGVPKVKSGCQTCKIRHKKCNEARPACFQCSSTGRQCDFTPTRPPRRVLGSESHPGLQVVLRPNPPVSGLPGHMANLTGVEASYFDYFRLVCAAEFGLFFETPSWESLVLRVAHTEPSIYHAALAIGALSRYRYCPQNFCSQLGNHRSVLEYSMGQYNLAIQGVNRSLGKSTESAELAILGSILFFNIEFLQGSHSTGGFPNFMRVHLQGAFAILHNLKSRSQNTDYLETALYRLREQLSMWDIFIECTSGQINTQGSLHRI